MELKTVCIIATILLATATKSAIVGAPTNVENPLAVEQPATEANRALAARNNDPFKCDGWCWGDLQCCLIASIYSRCHTIHTPCSALSFPDALSAPGPQPPVDPMPTTSSAGDSTASGATGAEVTITTTLTRAATTFTLTVEAAVAAPIADISAGVAAKGQLAETAEGVEKLIITEITTQVISVTAQSTVTASMSTISTPAILPTSDATATTNATAACPSDDDAASFPCATSLALTYEPTDSTTTTSTITEAAPETSEQSTVTSVATTVASATTTSVGSLHGEPSAIASDVGQTGAAAELVGGLGSGFAVLAALGAVGAVAVML